MQDEGLVDDEKVEGRRVYALTDAGRDYVSDREDEVLGAFDAFVRDEREHGAAGSSGIEDYGRLMFGVGAAAVQVARAGTPEQLEQARRILEGTRRQLYRVLSEEHDDE
jgi:DNA-binding PadR family transcriptional regulator